MLGNLIERRNAIDELIVTLIGRPLHSGHFAKYAAATICRIILHPSASTKADDGCFVDGPLKGSISEHQV